DLWRDERRGVEHRHLVPRHAGRVLRLQLANDVLGFVLQRRQLREARLRTVAIAGLREQQRHAIVIRIDRREQFLRERTCAGEDLLRVAIVASQDLRAPRCGDADAAEREGLRALVPRSTARRHTAAADDWWPDRA